jgi:hypothetical protein
MSAHTTGKNKWDTQWGVATMANLFKGYESGNNAIEFPSRRNHSGIQALVEQLIAWYPTPNMNRAPTQDCVMALWFCEIRCRELLDFQDGSSHWDAGWLSEREREEQVVINIDWYQASQSYGAQPALPEPTISNPARWWEA